ncbi:MAG TPA: discoidin domain-containing protein [Vicinamibacterales bacterium]|nr:discoidin domain-containing protein [Vicinamibacterales bacterium]
MTAAPRSRLPVRTLAVLAIYASLAAICTRPLVERAHDRIANDPYDPILNASILWWNAKTLPFSTGWWTPPHFYPSTDVAALTESLVGISVLASPILWLTGNPLLTYNIALFLTWPLSAFAAYLLALLLTRRHDAAFAAGLAFGFAPYRAGQISHLQVVSAYWFPLVFVGLHGYAGDRRPRWLLLFGAAWVLQSLANGYFMLFGAVLVGLWLVYFGSRRASWRAVPVILAVWIAATLPIVPVFLKYRSVQERYGLSRSVGEAIGYSAEPWGFTQVSQTIWFWYPTLGDTNPEVNLFPGATAPVLILLAGLGFLLRHRREDPAETLQRRVARRLLGATAVASLGAAVAVMSVGPWRVTVAGLMLRMSDPVRALLLALTAGAAYLFLTPRTREALARREPLAFYAAATAAVALFCLGPQIRHGSTVLLDPAPYGLLMYLPGFEGLRVPPRFWMLGALCLATAAGLAFASLVPRTGVVRRLALAAATTGLLLDGWIRGVTMAPAPEHWPRIEHRGSESALIELPLGPPWDAAATFRALRHGRRVVNGVSGYDPPYYAPLQEGLNAADHGMLLALASLGPLEVVVDSTQDPGGDIERYVSSLDGVERVRGDGLRTLYRLPDAGPRDTRAGGRLAVTRIRASAGEGALAFTSDGDVSTYWRIGPQRPDQWIEIDLGSVHEVGSLILALGEAELDFPRRLSIDLSLDGSAWRQVWEGTTAGEAVLAAIRAPREIPMMFTFAGTPARFVRLRQLGSNPMSWTVAELSVHRPGR